MSNRNPTPKANFLQDKQSVKVHADIFSSALARAVIDTALLQYQRTVCLHESEYEARFNRIKGASDFVEVLLNLGETFQPAKNDPKGNLIH
jgi:hypothetical protein